jgi:hypothetical protein
MLQINITDINELRISHYVNFYTLSYCSETFIESDIIA